MYFSRIIFLIAILQTVAGILMAQQTGIITPNAIISPADTMNLFNADQLLVQQMSRMPEISDVHPWRYGDGGLCFSEQPIVHSSHIIKSLQKLGGYLNKKIIKQPFEGRAAIVLNMLEPLFVNPSQKDFKQNGKAALMGGYCMYPNHSGSENINDNSLAFGINLSRWIPFRKHIQWEMIVSIYNSPERWAGQIQAIDSTIDFVRVKGSVLFYELAKLSSIDIIPIKMSYRLSDFLSLVAGSLISFNFITHRSSQQTKYFLQSDNPIPSISVKKEIPSSQWFKGSDMALFADVQMSEVRAGPALGLRFMHCINGPANQLFFYASWRL
jgi:hypothetical protein